MIPSPNVAEDHQTKNAMALVDKGAAVMIRDTEAEERLEQVLTGLLSDEKQRKELEKQLERYDSRVMTDRDAANVAAVLLTAAGDAAALVPQDTTDRDSGQSAPAVLVEPKSSAAETEVVLDGTV